MPVVKTAAPRAATLPPARTCGPGRSTRGAPLWPPDGDVVHPEVFGLRDVRGPVVQPEHVGTQIGGGAPAHVLHVDLLHAVHPQGLTAVGLAGGVELDVVDDLLPLAADERDLGSGLVKAIPVAAAHVRPIRV